MMEKISPYPALRTRSPCFHLHASKKVETTKARDREEGMEKVDMLAFEEALRWSVATSPGPRPASALLRSESVFKERLYLAGRDTLSR